MPQRRRRWWRRKLPGTSNWWRTIAVLTVCTVAMTIVLSKTSTDPRPLSLFNASIPAPFPSIPDAATGITAAASEPSVVGAIFPGQPPPRQIESAPIYAPFANNSESFPESPQSSTLWNDTAADVVDDDASTVQNTNPPQPESPPIAHASYASPKTSQLFTVSDHSNEGIVRKEEAYNQKSVPPVELEVQKSLRRLSPEQALDFAKREVDHAPLVSEDPDLYAPLFRNISAFKRSYELMERILKVYIYQDGSRPFFHTPPIKGIYASEGWFMKILERNKQFAIKDGNRAHLFYLPYSVHQLELALYAPGSQNIKHMSLFIKDYVNRLSSNYPYWNRTHGSDHFIVACHDWGPYTTKEHTELFKNSIKALCNADISEGIFVRGRDVSLPETTIKVPRRPLRAVGGKPISQRNILAFFAGNLHGRVRPVLLRYWDGKDEDMRIYGPLPNKVSKKMSYIEHMKSSKFCICPMGFEVNSPRIVEAIYYECVPVIIADNFVLPLDDVLNWKAFSVTVEEKDLPNLKDILMKISFEQYTSMHANVQKVQKHFLWHAKPLKYDIFHMILHSIWSSRLNQLQI